MITKEMPWGEFCEATEDHDVLSAADDNGGWTGTETILFREDSGEHWRAKVEVDRCGDWVKRDLVTCTQVRRVERTFTKMVWEPV